MMMLRPSFQLALLAVRSACLSGGRRSRRPKGPRPPPRVLQRVDGGVPEIARCDPERYDELLAYTQPQEN